MKLNFIQTIMLRFCGVVFILTTVFCSCNRSENSTEDKNGKTTLEGNRGKLYPQIAPSLVVSGSALPGPSYTVPLGTQVTVGAIFSVEENFSNITGTVTIKDGQTVLCTRTLTTTSQTVTCPQTQFYNAGTHEFYLDYEGDANYEAVANGELATLNVNKAIPSMSLETSASSLMTLGVPISLTVSVGPSFGPSGLPIVTGKVQIMNGIGPNRNLICKGYLKNGQLTCNNIVLKPAGIHRLSVIYSGDRNYYPLNSDNARTIKITKLTP